MKLLILLCCVLSTAFAVPVRRLLGLSSHERGPILIAQGASPLPQLPGFTQFPQLSGFAPFTQGALPQQAAQYAPWNRFPELYGNFYGFPVGGMPPPVGGMPPPVGGMPPPIGGMPPPIGGRPPPIGGMPPPLGVCEGLERQTPQDAVGAHEAICGRTTLGMCILVFGNREITCQLKNLLSVTPRT